jgi:FkbM family methyltransferase
MIIEIGTSDFRTKAGQVDGVFIEPVKYYYDRMVDLALKRDEDFDGGMELYAPTTYFENVAISDYEGEAQMHSVASWAISDYNLPPWIRGCSSINEPHPSAIKILNAGHVPSWSDIGQPSIKRETVQVVRIKSIIDKYNITSLDLLKIDTEGHDCIILNDYLNTVEILPKVIQFESNELSDPKEVAKVCARLKPLGYDCKQVKYDMICQLH